MKIFTILKEEIIPKTFVLSESQMFDLLLEAASLGDVYTKYYNQIPEDEFRQIVAADPTAGEDKMGKYSKWLLALYTNEELKLEDLYKATEYLTTFHKYKNKLEKKDIGQYKSLGELYQAIEPYADNTQAASHKEEIRQIKKGAKKVYEDDEWLVIVPETKEAAIEYGKGTQWCTAATGSTNYFDYYNERGPLYINIDKKTGQKLQFHFNSQQFMDETDCRFRRNNYNFTNGLYNFYRQQYGKDALLLRYDYVGYESDGLTYVQVNVGEGNHKCNFIDENENPISDEWFDDASYFDDNGLAIVYNGYKQNYLKRDGTLLLDKWCNKVNKFSDGFGIISDNNLKNYVDINGNILCDVWFDTARNFHEGAAVVGLLHDGDLIHNAINSNGEYLFDTWFKKTGMRFNDGILQVSLDNNKMTYIKKDGEFLTDMSFDVTSRFSYGCAVVKKNGLYNVINKNGELLFDQWYYDISYFGKGSGDEFDGFDCFFRLNNQQGLTLADRNGDIICDNWYDSIDDFKGGCAIVNKQGLWNVIGLDGKEICNEWLSYIYRDGDFMICHNQEGKRNLLSPYGGFAFEKWHDFFRLDRLHTNNYRTYDLLGYDYGVSGGGPTEVIHNAEKFKFILRKTNEAKQRKTITITESQYKELLKESQESKSISAAKKLVMDKMGWDEQRADEFIRKELRHDFSVLHHNSKAGKFILGLTRMFLDRQLTDGGTIQQLNRTLELVASDAHINEYDRNLNGMSAQELIDRFATARKEIGDKDREENATLDLQENNDYTIVPINNFEQSSQYGKYTSWCVTHSPNMLDSYTSDGIGQFYFCLKNGFENVPKERGEGCPLDEYGLSMVAVSVDKDGNLNTCTCRWNHDCGGDDHIMDTKQISQLIGRNFYEVFKPNNKWETAVEDVIQRLANGENPETLFDEVDEYEVDKKYYYYVRLFNQWNVVVKEENTEEFKLISPNLWFNNIWNIYDTIFPVEKNNKWNYLKEDGTLLSPNQWFDSVDKKNKDGFSRVNLNHKMNFINITNGNLLSPNLWFDILYDFVNGFAKVILNGRENLIDTNGNLKLKEWVGNIYYNNNYETNDDIIFISENGEGFNFVTTDNFEIKSDIWFDSMGEFIDGFSMVEKNRQYNFVDKNGNLLSNQWFDDTSSFREGFARIDINEKENYIDKNGNLLSNQWFYYCTSFKNGFGRVKTEDRKMNFVDQNGNLLCNQWFKKAYSFENGFARVQNGETPNDEAWNYIKPNGELLCGKWYTNAHNFYPEGIAFVEMNGLQNMINTNGEEILNKWVEEIVRVQDNFFAILYNGKFNFINSEGKLLFEDWFDFYYFNGNNIIKVTKDDKMNFIIDGKLLSNLWFDDIELYYGSGRFSRVMLNGKYNYLKQDGTLLSPNQWFDRAGLFSSYDGTAYVYIDKIRYILNSNGELFKDDNLTYYSIYK